jgi:hypothetical protein
MMQLTRLAEPAIEPISIEQLSGWSQAAISSTTNDLDSDAQVLLLEMLRDSRDRVERFLGRALIRRSFKATFDAEDLQDAEGVEVFRLFLPIGPLVTLDTATFTDEDDVESSLLADLTAVPGNPGYIILKADEEWPTYPRERACLTLTFTAGDATGLAPIAVTCTNTTAATVTGSDFSVTATYGCTYFFAATHNPMTFTIYGDTLASFTGETSISATTLEEGKATTVTIAAPTKTYYRVKCNAAGVTQTATGTVSGYNGVIAPNIKTAIKELTTHFYNHRGSGLFAGAGGFKGEVPDTVPKILRRITGFCTRRRIL